MSTAALCPYCRGPVEGEPESQKICEGCGTPHHQDCFQENGGCTVFGCSFAPAEEPELSISRADLANSTRTASPPTSRTLGLSLAPAPEIAPPSPPIRVKAPPPPMPSGTAEPPVPVEAPAVIQAQPITFGSGSVLFGARSVSSVTLAYPAMGATVGVSPTAADVVPDTAAKNRTTFIVLGVLLGFLGAHNFYAGYKKKAIAQLCISIFTAGFAIPMTWIWAVIDVCTINRDSAGKNFGL
jgi:hypothetical protein